MLTCTNTGYTKLTLWLTATCVLQLKLMTSWAVVCDVYFLEPQTKHEDESSQQFAERVQKLIANRAKLHIAPWDGYLKYYNLGDKVWLFGVCLMLINLAVT